MNHHRNGLMQLQRDDQEAKIRELKRKQLEFYKKQKVCETFATLTVISSFATFSLYVIFQYGFDYLFSPQYSIIYKNSTVAPSIGENISLICRTDDYWEWCR